MIRRNERAVGFLLAAVIVLACVPGFGTNFASTPTIDPNSLNTIIAETANAAFTQTAFFITPTDTPTVTSTATFTPSVTSSPTATFLFILSTPTVATPVPAVGSSGKKFECGILSKTPVDGFGYSANIEFTTTWVVLNVGTEAWEAANADVRYLSGDKLHLSGALDLDSDVPSGSQIEIKVPMKAPGNPGTYVTTWVIKSKTDEYCRMSISITVM